MLYIKISKFFFCFFVYIFTFEKEKLNIIMSIKFFKTYSITWWHWNPITHPVCWVCIVTKSDTFCLKSLVMLLFFAVVTMNSEGCCNISAPVKAVLMIISHYQRLKGVLHCFTLFFLSTWPIWKLSAEYTRDHVDGKNTKNCLKVKYSHYCPFSAHCMLASSQTNRICQETSAFWFSFFFFAFICSFVQ